MDYFGEAVFELGMGFLIDSLDYCIENHITGWITKKFDIFTVSFIFPGIKMKIGDMKRKTTGNLSGVSKKIRKLNVSVENLFLCDDQIDSTSVGCSRSIEGDGDGKHQTTKMDVSDQDKQSENEFLGVDSIDSNLACCLHDGERKRQLSEIGDRNQDEQPQSKKLRIIEEEM